MARPKISEHRRRTEKVWARVTTQEKAILREQAKASGLSLSDEMRRAVGQPPRDPPVELPLLARINGQMGKIGSNANQVARVLNEGGYPEAAAFEQVKTDVAWIRAQLAKALRIEPC